MPGVSRQTPHRSGPTERRETRQRLLRRVAKAIGTVVVLGAGDLISRAGTAAAAPFCCELVFPDQSGWCSGYGGSQTCPSDHTIRFWQCCDSGYRRWTCYECVKGGTTCFNGTHYACSGLASAGTCSTLRAG